MRELNNKETKVWANSKLYKVAINLGASVLVVTGVDSMSTTANSIRTIAETQKEPTAEPHPLRGASNLTPSESPSPSPISTPRVKPQVSRSTQRQLPPTVPGSPKDECWDGDSSNFRSTKEKHYDNIYRACELAQSEPWADDNFQEQMDALIKLWDRESGWNPKADNPNSSAYGIPQALPGSKMGKGWQDNPDVQIRWGLEYVSGRYGTPINAWEFFKDNNWY